MTINGTSKAHYVVREDDTSRAGAVYIFSRVTAENASVVTRTPSASPGVSSCPDKDDDVIRFVETRRRYYCPRGRSRRKCVWEESARLTASDRRGGDLFGAAISVNHESGLVVIGAPGKSLTGIWQEVCSVDGYFPTLWNSENFVFLRAYSIDFLPPRKRPHASKFLRTIAKPSDMSYRQGDKPLKTRKTFEGMGDDPVPRDGLLRDELVPLDNKSPYPPFAHTPPPPLGSLEAASHHVHDHQPPRRHR